MRLPSLCLIAAAVCACNLHGDAAPAPDTARDAGAPPVGSALPDPVSTGADHDEDTDEPAEAPVPTAGQPFSLAVGEMVTVDALDVTFVAVREDSRCPEGVDCVWAGNAAIELALAEAGAEPARIELNTNPDFATRATYRDHVVELLELHPRPRAEGGERGPYRARLRISAGG